MSVLTSFRVFLSAVSSEFAAARTALAGDLRARGLDVKVQDDFRQEAGADTTLRKLHDYIRDCAAVVCVIGRRSGAVPPDTAVRPFAPLLPASLSEASYTQWEFFFARHHARRLSLYLANDDHVPDQATPNGADFPELQTQFVAYLVAQGLDRSPFSTTDQLCRLVLKEDWPLLPRSRPNTLPYASLGSLFKGRDDFLDQLRERLTAAGDRAVGVLAAQPIHGLGGVGKTRMAVEYAWRREADYTALLFVSADTPANLRRNLAELVGPLVLNLKEAQQAKEEEVRVAAALDWLEAHPGWFLILDNVDTEEAARAVESLLPRLRRGHVVITSRLRAWAGVRELELDVLDGASASAFLLERTAGRRRPTPADETDARALAAALDGLALALEQAGAYVSHVRCSLADYLARWRKQEEQVLTWFDQRQMKYPRSMAVTWEATREQLSPAARALLETLAWFAPDPIPEWVLLGEAAQPVVAEALAGADVALALAELERYSLLRREVTAERWSLLVHRLVQEVTRRGLAAPARRRRLEEALRLVDVLAGDDPVDVRMWPVWVPLSPHVRALVDHAEQAGIDQPTARLMNDLGLLLDSKALHTEAEPLFRRALAMFERSSGAPPPDVATALNNLAMLLKDTNRLAEAEPLMRRALATDERSLGAEHSTVARDLNNLAALLKDTNRLAEAEPLMRRALAIDERISGAEHPKVAIHLNSLAVLLQDTNRLPEAEPLMRRALAIDERSFGAEHPKVALRLNNLAWLLKDTNRSEEAELLMRRALAIDECSFGTEHPNVARDLSNLALLLQARNRLAEGEPLMRRALAIDERSFGTEHPTVAIHLNNLAQLLRATNRLAEAELMMRRALAIDERSFGHDHPTVAINLNNLAQLLQATNRLAEAQPLSRSQLLILLDFTRRTGHEHPHLQAALANYRALLKALGRSETYIQATLDQLNE